MIRTCLVSYNVLDLFLRILLDNFLKNSLVVTERCVLLCFKIFRNESENMCSCSFKSSVKEYCRNKRFESIGKYRRSFTSACILLAFSKKKILSEIDLLCKYVKRFFAYQRSSYLCEFAFRKMRKMFEKIL